MNNNPSVHDYFGLKAESIESKPKVVSEKEFIINFMSDAFDNLKAYEDRISQLAQEYSDLDRQLSELKSTRSKGIVQAFVMAWKERSLEQKMRKNRDLNLLVHDKRLQMYQVDFAKFKENSTRIYGTNFAAEERGR